MAWLFTLTLAVSLLQQSVTSHDSNATQPLNHNNLSNQALHGLMKTLRTSHHAGLIEERVDNRLSKDLLLPLLPNFSMNEGSGEGSGLQQSLEIIMPSTGPLEMDMLIPDIAEKQDLEKQEFGAHPSPPIAQKLTQHINDDDNDDDDQDIILETNNNATDQVTSTATTHTYINNNERMDKDQALLTSTNLTTETNTTGNFTVNLDLQTYNIDVQTNNNEDVKTSQDSNYVASTQNIQSSITKPETSGNNGTVVMQPGTIQEPLQNLLVGEERYVTNHPPAATPTLQAGKCSSVMW